MQDKVFHVLDYGEFDNLVNEHLKPALFYEVVPDQEWDNDESHLFEVIEDEYQEDEREEVREFIANEGLAFTSPALLLCELATRGVIPWGDYIIEVSW